MESYLGPDRKKNLSLIMHIMISKENGCQGDYNILDFSSFLDFKFFFQPDPWVL